MKNYAFTLIEIMIVIVIIAIIATIAVPAYNGFMIKAKMTEIKPTVDAIIKAEEVFYLANGFYASTFGAVSGYDLSPDDGAAFERILNITIPTTARSSYFTYEVYGNPATIYVRNSDNFPVAYNFESVVFAAMGIYSQNILCSITLSGPGNYTWTINTEHSLSGYLDPPKNVTVVWAPIGDH